MDTGHQLRAVWGYRRWLVLFALATALVVDLVSRAESPSYQASSIVRVVPAAQSGGQILTADQLQSVTSTYLQLMQNPGVYRLAAAAAREPGHDIADNLNVDSQENSAVFSLSGTAGSPARATRYANAYATAFKTQVDKLQQSSRTESKVQIQDQIDAVQSQLNGLASTPRDPRAPQLQAQLRSLNTQLSQAATAVGDSVQVLESALPPSDPVSPRPSRDAVLALFAALVVGAAAIYARVALVDRYADGEEAAADLGVSLLGELPRGAPREQSVVEAFRRLRTSVVFAVGDPRPGEAASGRFDPLEAAALGAGGPPWTVLVTAAERGAGKSYVTTNLSRTLAADGWRVVAVDGDLRRPTLHDQFGVKPRPGLAEVLSARTVQLAGMVAQRVPIAESRGGRLGALDVVSAGTPISDSTERLSSRYMATALDSLSADHDFVVLDSSPLGPVVDAAVLARYARGVVLVVDARRSRRRAARRALEALRAIEAPVLGIIYNRGAAASSYEVYETVPAASESEPDPQPEAAR